VDLKEQEQEIIALQTQILELRKQSSRVWDQIGSLRHKAAILNGKKEMLSSYRGYYIAIILWFLYLLGFSKFGELFGRNLATIGLFLSTSAVLVIPLIIIKLVIPSYETKIMKYKQPIKSLLEQTRAIYSSQYEKEKRILQLELLIESSKSSKQKT
jgi:ABC-type transport system involved in multi-copper enzyme maturation permease subunit